VKNLVENTEALLQAIVKARPTTAKGVYVKTVHLASTMGPGLRIDYQIAAV
jgi:large subunit ribosomal protein L1